MQGPLDLTEADPVPRAPTVEVERRVERERRKIQEERNGRLVDVLHLELLLLLLKGRRLG
jgi:hypothetical protein